MGSYRVRRAGGAAAAALAVTVGLSGCLTGLGGDPGQMLARAADGVRAADGMPFAATTDIQAAGVSLTADERTGTIDGGLVTLHRGGTAKERILVRQASGWAAADAGGDAAWPAGAAIGSNPLAALDRLQEAAAGIKREAGDAAGSVVLRVDADSDKMAKIWRARLGLSEDEWRAAAAARRGSATLSETELERLAAELAAVNQTYRPLLEERLEHLWAETRYVLHIGPGNRLEQLEESTRLDYEADGERRQELVVETYRFPAAEGQDRVIAAD